MDVSQRSPRVDITISINPEFELRLDALSVQDSVPTAAEFDGSRLEAGHARFSIFSEVGEITTGAFLFVEYTGEGNSTTAAWRLVVQPRPALEPLAGAMEKLVLTEGGDAIGRRAEGGMAVRPQES